MSDILNEFIKDLILIDENGKVHSSTDEVVVKDDLVVIKTKFIDDMDQIMHQLIFRVMDLKTVKLSSIITKSKKEITLYFEEI
jgi:hypothetical protein